MKSKILIAFIIIVVVGVAVSFSVEREKFVTCTTEALLCPDGSGVGRGGPECTFTPCPNQPFFEGTLRQTSEGFRLITETTGSGTYSIPLEIRVSNALQEFVDTDVRVYGEFVEGNTLRVETLEEVE